MRVRIVKSLCAEPFAKAMVDGGKVEWCEGVVGFARFFGSCAGAVSLKRVKTCDSLLW